MGLISLVSTNSTEKKSRRDRVLNQGLLGEKLECYLCAMQPARLAYLNEYLMTEPYSFIEQVPGVTFLGKKQKKVPVKHLSNYFGSISMTTEHKKSWDVILGR